jgi:hypothetical protein
MVPPLYCSQPETQTKQVWTLVPHPFRMPSPAPPLQPVLTPRPPQMRRPISLRASLHTDGPTPPSLLHSPLLNATIRGPATYPTTSFAESQSSSRRPSESASSVSSSSRASSHFSAMSTLSSTSSAAPISYLVPRTISPHAQRSRFASSTESHSPPSIFHHTRTPSWSSPAASSSIHAGEFDDDPWRILDTVPAPPHRDCSITPAPTTSTPLAVRAAAAMTVPPGIRTQHTHVPHPPVSHHAQIGLYAPPEFSSHQQSQSPTRRLGAGTTPLVSSGVGNTPSQDPNSTPILRNGPHSPP